MYTIAVFSPFIGSLFAGRAGRWRGARGSATISILGLFISFVLSLCLCYEVGIAGSTVYISLGQWFSASSVSVMWGLYFDSLTVCMMFTVTLVSACVHLYSVSYMQNDPHLPRFMSYLSLFTGFMLIRVSAPHMVQMLVGWEGILQCLNDSQCFLLCSLKKIFYEQNLLYSIFFKKIYWNEPLLERSSSIPEFKSTQKRTFYVPGLPAKKRVGFHTVLFQQRCVGFFTRGWLEKHGQGVRLGISISKPYKDLAQFYRLLRYGLGYIKDLDCGTPLKRKKVLGKNGYFQISTFRF